jgi:lactoylglutathione lyase
MALICWLIGIREMAGLTDFSVIELNHVALPVADVERSLPFYRDILGLAPLPRPDFPFPGAWFRLGHHQELHLIGDERTTAGSGQSMDGHFALLVKDLAPVAARLREAGLNFRGPGPRPDGALQIFVTDPDGNVIEFCCNLPAGP